MDQGDPRAGRRHLRAERLREPSSPGKLGQGGGRKVVVGDAMSDARSARRAKMSEHERLVEDLHEEFTEAVRRGTIGEFFMRIAAEKLELASLRASARRTNLAMRDAVNSAKKVQRAAQAYVDAVAVANSENRDGTFKNPSPHER